MNMCRQVGERMPELASLPPANLPVEIARHLAACPACRRALTATRVTRGLMAVPAEGPEPPPQFAGRVLRALPVRDVQAPADPWRPAWGLVPAFATLVVGLCFLYQTSLEPNVPALLAAGDLSTSEELVLGTADLQRDLVLAAVLEGDGP
jgi:hypothetical protein